MSSPQARKSRLELLWARGARFLAYMLRLALRPKQVNFDNVAISVNYTHWSPYMTRRVLCKDYERDERKLVRDILNPGDRVLEIGGGIGLIALAARESVSDESIVVYEANPDLISDIKRNFELNGAHIKIINAAIVSDDVEAETTSFYVHCDFWASGLDSDKNAETVVTVNAVRLKDALEKHRPNVLIVDVEGAECAIFANTTLPGVDLLCVETHPHKTGVEASSHLVRSLLNAGFEVDLGKSHDGVLLFMRPSRLKSQKAALSPPTSAMLDMKPAC